MFKKYYTFELIDSKGIVSGSGCCRVWLWQSPVDAHKESINAIPSHVKQINFRRIK